MTKWVSDWGEEFETIEEARDDASQIIDYGGLYEFLAENIPAEEIIRRAFKYLNDPWIVFEDEILQYEDDWFTTYYHEEEDEEDE